jgi:ABC-2 type transport system permease protein/ribosome-dependent ATPase
VSLRRLRAIIRKEIQHIIRDRATFVLVLLTPLTMLFVFAYALTVDIEHVPIAVLDHDHSPSSRVFIQRVTEGKDLDLHALVESLREVNDLLIRGHIKAALVIQPSFERDLLSLRGMPMQVVIDGTEPESGTFAVRQISGRAEAFAGELLARRMRSISLNSYQPIDLRVRALYNPGLKPRVDMVPGLISMMLGFPALSVALALAHEREHGTLEQVLVTPVGRAEFLLGKMIPYVIVGLINVIVMPLVARLTFHIPFNGDFLLFFWLSAVFLFAIVGMGIVIGVFMQTQPAALALSFLLIFFPGFFMTGIFFPIASMPAEVRIEAMSLPGTHYATITRGVFLTGVGLKVLWPNVVALLAMGIVFTTVAALFFKKRLR